MKKYFYAVITVTIFYTASLIVQNQSKEPSPIKRESAHTLTLFLAPYEKMQDLPEFKKDLKTELYQDPFYLSKKIVREKFYPQTDPRGVYVLYAGFEDIIDLNRQVRFPFLGTGEPTGEEFTLVITRKLKPVILYGVTAEYFVRTSAKIAYYTMKRNFDKEKNLYYWDISTQDVPNDKKIPNYAIIIFADPDNIFVPLEPTVAVPGSNIVLPTLYATKILDKDYNALSFIKLSHYFDPIVEVTKIAPPQRYGQKIGNIGTA